MTDAQAQESITFLASLPPIQSAISLDGQGDGARVKLDIPRSHVEAALVLQSWSERVLEVTIRPADKNIPRHT